MKPRIYVTDYATVRIVCDKDVDLCDIPEIITMLQAAQTFGYEMLDYQSTDFEQSKGK